MFSRMQRVFTLFAGVACAITWAQLAGCRVTSLSDLFSAQAVSGYVTPSSGVAGTRVAITGRNFQSNTEVLFGAFLGENTTIENSTLITSVAPAQASGSVKIVLLTPGRAAVTYEQAFEYLDPVSVDDGKAPQVVGAASLNNKTVIVTYSKPMGKSAAEPANYEISGSESSKLIVTGAELLQGITSVRLTTLTQDFDDYTLHAVGVMDIFGRHLAPPNGLLAAPDGTDPSRAKFRGTAPTKSEIDTDTDGDGLADWIEMKGWLVTIKYANGMVATSHVTSDPFLPDTDLDGLDDNVEHQWSYNPRSADTDADHLSDYDEFNVWFSDPLDQDTDGDGFGDHLEVTFFKTSPILADTDGDQLTDSDEVLNRNRNPRIADLPVIGVRVDESRLELDARYSYSDQLGRQQTEEKSYSNSVQRDERNSHSDNGGNVTTGTWHLNASVKGGYEQNSGLFVLQAEGGYSRATQDVNTWTTESARSMSQTYNQAVNQGSQFTSLSQTSRETLAARISSNVTLTSGSDIAFSVRDLEISVLQNDPRDRSRFIPVATLVPNNPNVVFNLGPLSPERGPLIFKNSEVFPSLVEELMKDPRGLIFRVANFNMTDELGRNFAFSSQEVAEKTARLIIDYGNGTQRADFIATAGPFDEFGRQSGITIEEALFAFGLSPWRPRSDGDSDEDPELGSVDNPADPRPKPNDPDVASSYGTRSSELVVRGEMRQFRRLTRVGGVQEDFNYDTFEPEKPNDGSFWAVFFADPSNSNPNNDPDNPSSNATTNFGELRMKAGQTYALALVQDKDKDGVTSREEFFSGSSDADADSDHDSLPDYLEIRGQWNTDGLGAWTVATSRAPGGYRAYPAPIAADSDDDGLHDDVEYGLCRYRYQSGGAPPTDAHVLGWFDDADANPDNPAVTWDSDPAAIPYLFPPSDGLPVAWYRDIDVSTGTPVRFPSNRASLDPRKADTDEDGVSDADEVNGYAITLYDDDLTDGRKQRIFVHTDPLNADTDGDGIMDGMERVFGTNPALSDSGVVFDDDLDGLPNRVEETGWWITVNGQPLHVVSNPNDPDSDNDGIPDYLERVIGTNPWYPAGVTADPNAVAPGYDTDADGLSDSEEWDGAIPPQQQDKFAFCDSVPNCRGYYVNPANTGTDPRLADTDEDGLDDGFEIQTGWVVRLFGEVAGYRVYSDPHVADGDNDGWLDGEEFAAGTDPTKVDTDDDGTPDPWEASRTASNGTRDPLRPDQRVTYHIVYGVVWDDGNDANSNAGNFDIYASLHLNADNHYLWTLTAIEGWPDCVSDTQSNCRRNCPEGPVIQFRDNHEIYPPGVSDNNRLILGPGDVITPYVVMNYWQDCHIGVPDRFWRPFEDGSGIRDYPVEPGAFVVDSQSSGGGFVGLNGTPHVSFYIIITVD